MIGLFAAGWLAAAAAAEPSPVSTGAIRPIALEEAYAAALRASEALAQRREAEAELEARIGELWSSVRPRLSRVGTEILQDSAGQSGAVTNSFAQSSRPQASIAAHQPLFSGLREFLAVKAARAQRGAAGLDLRRAEQSLFQDVARAYLDLLGVRKELDTRQEIIELTGDRIRELRQRERIGRSRKSEVLAAESQLSQAQSDVADARRRERLAQSALRFVTGLDGDLAPADVRVSTASPVDGYVERSRARPDVAARRQDVDAARLSVDIQRRQAWPTIAADGNYYLKRPAGFQADIRWDATISASLPLYYGGAISAQTAQAQARRRSAEAALGLAQRRAETDVRSAHDDLAASVGIVVALERSLDLARKNAEAQAADYRLGLVTNLDVLNALSSVQETRLRLDRARLAAVASKARLDVAAGAAP